MNSEMQKRLYEMEVIPPLTVWEKLSVNIDEINADNFVAAKILNTELIPPTGIWEKINSTINTVEEKKPEKKAVIFNLRRLAAAAVFIGIIVTAWVIFRNNKQSSTGLAGVEKDIPQKSTTDPNAVTKKSDNPNFIDSPVNLDLVKTKGPIATLGSERENKNVKSLKTNKNNHTVDFQYAVLNNESPKANSFDKPIDDLSLVTSDQNYLTMVNANGRLVKIPAQLASLAPHLQDKPISEDVYEVMFGEGAYWKETLNEWRKKVASSTVSSGDAFTSFVELLKSVQDK